jgi:hypothetical protein
VFSDSENVLQTNAWTFTLTYKALNPANARSGPGIEPGFDIRVVQATQETVGLENSLDRAEAQLTENSTIPAFYRTNVVAPVINFSQNGPDSADGYFPGDLLVPGLEVDVNGTDDIAMEILAYLELTAGTHRFGVRCDDGYKLISGASLRDSSAVPLAFHNGGPADETVDFVVSQSGMYPFRMVWYERGGGAHVEWFSVDQATGERTLINDLSTPGAIKAFVSVPAAPMLEVLSAPRIGAPFVPATSALVNSSARTITVPISGEAAFFLVRSGGLAVTLTGARVAGTDLVISYTLAP